MKGEDGGLVEWMMAGLAEAEMPGLNLQGCEFGGIAVVSLSQILNIAYVCSH